MKGPDGGRPLLLVSKKIYLMENTIMPMIKEPLDNPSITLQSP